MDSSTYAAILQELNATPATSFPFLSRIAATHGCTVATVFSIYNQETTYQVMKTHRQFVDASKSLFRMYLQHEITIAEICLNWRLPPCLVWRRLLESCSLLSRRHPKQKMSKNAINAVFHDPSKVAFFAIDDAVNVLAEELDVAELSRLYRTQEELVERVTKDIEEAVMTDMVMGPASSEARRQAGLEFEDKLYECLKEHDIAFWTACIDLDRRALALPISLALRASLVGQEDELRELNYIKTPDALLKVPIAVNGRAVTWIDSKATFADAKQHEKLLRDQYAGYINRFGPGLCVYWHSYLREVVEQSEDLVVVGGWPGENELTALPRLGSSIQPSIQPSPRPAPQPAPRPVPRPTDDSVVVLFCGREMHYGWLYTKEAAEKVGNVTVLQADRERVDELIAEAHVLVPLMTVLDRNRLEKATRARLIIQYGAGVEGVDAAAARDLGIALTNIPSKDTGNADSCSELAIFLMLACLRQINAMAKSIESRSLGVPCGRMLQGSTVCLVGNGNISRKLRPRLRGFGVEQCVLTRGVHDGLGDDPDVSDHARVSDAAGAARLLAKADIVVFVCALTPESKGMLNDEFLRLCKQGVIVVNVSRGGLLDEDCLLRGLESGKVAGCGLDVQCAEPLDPDEPLFKHPNVYCTPHVAGVTQTSYRNMAEVVVETAIQVVLRREPPDRILN